MTRTNDDLYLFLIQKINKSKQFKKNLNYTGIDLIPRHALQIENLKFQPFVDPDRKRLRKSH